MEKRQTAMLRSRPNHLGNDSTDGFERMPLNCRPDWEMIQMPENPADESEQNNKERARPVNENTYRFSVYVFSWARQEVSPKKSVTLGRTRAWPVETGDVAMPHVGR